MYFSIYIHGCSLSVFCSKIDRDQGHPLYQCEHLILYDQVWKIRWYMGKYGGASPKPHVGYANCFKVGKLYNGSMSKAEMAKLKQTNSLTKKYVNKAGRKCWVGTKSLKNSQQKP